MKAAIHIALVFAAIATLAHSANPDAQPKLSVTLGKRQSIVLKEDAQGRLTAKADAAGATVTAQLRQTTATPLAVEGDPTRPYLVVTQPL